MPTLSADDMRKKSSAGDYAGESRLDIFDLKIKDKKPFVVGSSASGTKVIGISYDRKAEILTYKVNRQTKEARRSQIFKDKDFGGGGGSGGGAADTALTESLQCFYNAYVFNVKKNKCESVSPAQLKSSAKFAHTDKSLADCLSKGPSDWIETDVYIKTANKLWEKYGRKMTKNGAVHFHRGSPFMNNLYNAKAECHKIDKASDDPQAPGSFSHDKWNPGDIWATTFGALEKPLSESTSSWGELNAQVLKLAKAGKLLGISLKKIGKNSPATCKEFNTPTQLENRDTFTYGSFKFGKTGDFFSSQDIYIDTSGGEIQFRTFGGDTSWQGEIKGGAAAGGKIGGGNVDFYCKQVFNNDIYNGKGSEKAFLSSIKSDKKWPSKAYEIYKKFNSKSKPSIDLVSEKVFLQEWANHEQGDNFRMSKSICLTFLEAFNSTGASKKKQHDLITKMFRYASSDVDQSSFFVKVS
tara:strand:+ start:4229 stop:5629 length:1401 start_codon:yes stop_codon:yes gene_type:complete